MATYEEHCKETVEKLGKPYEQVHQWLDALQPTMGPEHREIRHNLFGVKYCINKWGFEAGAAACIHIQRDEHMHVKEGDLWIPKEQQTERTK